MLLLPLLQKTTLNTPTINALSLHTTLAPAALSNKDLLSVHCFNHQPLLQFYHEITPITDTVSLVTSLPEELLDTCFQVFKIMNLKSSNAIFIKKCLQHTLAGQRIVSLHIHNGCFEIAITDDTQLIFYSICHFNNTEEFSYYLLFYFEKTNTPCTQTILKLTGEISTASPIYDICKKYVKRLQIGLDATCTDVRFEVLL